MGEFKGTKGKWELCSYSNIIQAVPTTGRGLGGLTSVCSVNRTFTPRTEYTENRKLIADAGNVRQQINCSLPELLTKLKEAKSVIGRLKRSMLVHPDCTEGSEFDDMTTTAQEMEDSIEELIRKEVNND